MSVSLNSLKKWLFAKSELERNTARQRWHQMILSGLLSFYVQPFALKNEREQDGGSQVFNLISGRTYNTQAVF